MVLIKGRSTKDRGLRRSVSVDKYGYLPFPWLFGVTAGILRKLIRKEKSSDGGLRFYSSSRTLRKKIGDTCQKVLVHRSQVLRPQPQNQPPNNIKTTIHGKEAHESNKRRTDG